MPDCLQGGCRRPIPWMTRLPLFLPRLTRPTGDSSQRSQLSLTLLANPLFLDVFVDDFVGLAQKHKQRVRCTLLEAVKEVFCPLSPTNPPTRREPISVKKLLEEDSSWSTIKLVLGWILDMENLTIQLPPHCVEHLWKSLTIFPPPNVGAAVVGCLYSVQYKSIFGAPDKVRRDTCEQARPLSQV